MTKCDKQHGVVRWCRRWINIWQKYLIFCDLFSWTFTEGWSLCRVLLTTPNLLAFLRRGGDFNCCRHCWLLYRKDLAFDVNKTECDSDTHVFISSLISNSHWWKPSLNPINFYIHPCAIGDRQIITGFIFGPSQIRFNLNPVNFNVQAQIICSMG